MDPQLTTTIHPITCLALLFMLIFIYYTLHYRKQHRSSSEYQIRQARPSYPEGYPFFASPFQAKPEIRNQGLYHEDISSKKFVKSSTKENFLHQDNDIRKNIPMKSTFEKETPSWNKLLIHAQEVSFPKTLPVPWEQRAFIIDRRNDYTENRRDSFNPKNEDEFYLYNVPKESSEKDNSNYLMPNLNHKAYKSSKGHIEGQTLYQENNRVQKTVPSVIERFDLGLSKFKQEEKSHQDIFNIESISRITSDQNTTVNAPQVFLEGFGTCVSLEYPSRSESLSNPNKLVSNNGIKLSSQEYPVYHANFGTFGKETRMKEESSSKQNKEYDNRDPLHSFKKRKWDNRTDELESSKVPLQGKNSKALKIDFGKLEESVSSIQFTEPQRIEEENTESTLINHITKKVKQNDVQYDNSKVKISFPDDRINRGDIIKTQPASHNISKKETFHKIISGLGTESNIKHRDERMDKFEEDKIEEKREFKLDDRFVSNRKKKRDLSPEDDKKVLQSRVRGDDKTQNLALKFKNTQKPFNYQKKIQHPIVQTIKSTEKFSSTKVTMSNKKQETTSKIEAEWNVILEKIDADLENDSIIENPNSEFKEVDVIKKYKFDDITMFTPSKDIMNQNGEVEDIPLTELVEQACSKDSI